MAEKVKERGVRTPRGFGKTYFTLSSILAYSAAQKMHIQVSRMMPLLCHATVGCHDHALIEEDPPLELLPVACTLSVKACHCHGLDELKTRLALLINTFIPRCPYYTTCFAFRRTGVHPPVVLS